MIKREFDLTSNENVYDDFGCTLKTPGWNTNVLNSIMQGRIYLTDHYICFNNSMVGNKVKLPIRDIVSITKNKFMGLFNTGIMITQTNQETKQLEKYQFGQFDNRDLAYKRIDALWRNIAPEEVWRGNKSNLGSSTDNEFVTPKFKENMGQINIQNQRKVQNNHTDNEKDFEKTRVNQS